MERLVGGHRIAAGASVPKDKINEFLVKMGESLDKQRKTNNKKEGLYTAQKDRKIGECEL